MEIMTSEQLSELMQKANAGDPEAQFKVGECYQNGNGTEQDVFAAAGWYEKAAEQGHGHAQTRLGMIYLELGTISYKKELKKEEWRNFGVANQYLEKAGKWLNAAKDNGFNAATRFPLRDLDDVVKDIKHIEDDQAKKKLRLDKEAAAAQGDAEAQYWLGQCLKEEKDYVNAAKWYEKAAIQGNAAAQFELAECYNYGDGIEKDRAAAVKWFKKAAEQGHLDAMVRIGKLYAYGTVNKWNNDKDPSIDVEIDYSKAVEWCRKAKGNHSGYSVFDSYIDEIERKIRFEKLKKERDEQLKLKKEQEQAAVAATAEALNETPKYVDRSISYQVLGIVAALLLVGFTILFSYIGAGKGTEKVGGAFLGTILTFVCIAGIFVTGVASFALIGNNFSTATVIIGGILGIAGSIVVMTALADYPVIKKYVIYYAAVAVFIQIIVIIFRKARRPKN